MKYCILGAGGAFGLHTAKYLLSKGHEVIGIGRAALRPDYFSLGAARWPWRYYTYHIGHEIRFVQGLLREAQPDIIVNFAAQGEGAASWNNADLFFDTNCTALTRLVEWLDTEIKYGNKLQRFIQIGSSEVYGSVDAPADEESPLRPSSPYSASKAGFDLYLLAMAKHRHFPMNILRPSNAYCPGQALHRVIPKAIVYGLTGRRLQLHGGGRAEKSYIHATDLARAIHLVSQHGELGHVYNVGPKDPTQIITLVVHCANALGMNIEELAEIAPERLGQDARYWLNSDKIRDLGWEPQIDLAEGLAEMVAWGKKYLPHLRELSTDYVMRG